MPKRCCFRHKMQAICATAAFILFEKQKHIIDYIRLYTSQTSGGFKGGGRAGSGPPFGRRTDAVTVLLISENGSVLWRPIVS